MPARLPAHVLSLLQHSSKARVLTEGCSPCHRSRSFAAAQRRHRQRRRRLADARALTSAQLIIAAADQQHYRRGARLAVALALAHQLHVAFSRHRARRVAVARAHVTRILLQARN